MHGSQAAMQAQAPAASPTLVYVASALSNEITAFVAHPADGRLELMQRISVSGNVTPLAINPNRRFLYAGLRTEQPSAASFAIDPATGNLRALGTALLADPPMYLATDASGKFLFSASYVGATFAINAIRSDGSVEPGAIQRSRTPPHAHGILVDPSNRFLFVTSLGGNVILQYIFDPSTGLAIPNAVPFVATPKGSGPRHMVFHPRDNVLYVNGELDGSICSYGLNPDTGRLRALSREYILPEPVNIAPWAAELAITPDGRYLYASERRTSTLTIFEVGAEPGALLRRDIVPSEAQPRSFALDPSGRFLIIAGETSNHITVYHIDPATGGLTAQSRYSVGAKPTWVTAIDLRDA